MTLLVVASDFIASSVIYLVLGVFLGIIVFLTIDRSSFYSGSKQFLEVLAPTLNSLNEGILVFDNKDHLTYINDTFYKLSPMMSGLIKVGMTREEVVNLYVSRIEDEDSLRRLQENYAASKNNPIDRNEGTVVKLPTGRFMSYTQKKTPSGGLFLFIRDITEDVAKRETLQFQSELLDIVYENLPLGICILDKENNIISWNRSLQDITGLQNDEIYKGKPYHLHLLEAFDRFSESASTPEEFADSVLAAFESKFPTRAERVLKNGKIVEIYRATLDDGRKICTITDVTLQRTTDKILKDSEKRYREMVEHSPEAIFVHKNSIVIYANDAAVKLLEAKDLHDVIGTKIDRYFAHEDLEKLQHHLYQDEDLDTDTDYPAETGRIILNSGDLVDVEVDSTSLLYGKKPVLQVIVRNISAQKKTQELLKQAKEEAEYAAQLKSTFLANMSHELRTPLNAVIGFSEIIRGQIFGKIGSPKYVEYADDIHASGLHLLDLINDILDLSKVDAGGMDLLEEKIDVSEIIKVCMRIAEPQRAKSGVYLEFEEPDTHPKIHADKKMLKQVLLNLLSNAFKFTPQEGKVSINVKSGTDGSLTITVSDEGIGIKKNDIEKALTAFVQIDGELGRKYQGTGLGLPLSKRLMELHGGTLDLKSSFGNGTTVYLSFPAERVLTKAA
ncbi:PAS domain S-box protein [Sneathiella sp. P13V-1]|uniref:sensor histidine kinase n=1 Tax=Sneathiella sp. P13V-1 TaxID=2697366 RepID=UPI00187BAE0F|nr:PAS-domain containing protein [Sneathiella sp. P13V-1]MBE7637377.1 PAS domain S-box protein [Sneathiella sp. P13V-1]